MKYLKNIKDEAMEEKYIIPGAACRNGIKKEDT